MDNDYKIVKRIKGFIKNAKFKLDYKDLKILPDDLGNKLIYDLIFEGKSCMVCRAGATEMRCVDEYLKNKTFSDKIRKEIWDLSGVFPANADILEKFCKCYISCMQDADVISLWGVGAESKVVHEYCKGSAFTELHALEPYYFDAPWSAALKDKKVLVIHPFSESIKKQYDQREKLFSNQEILPEFAELHCIPSVQSIAGNVTGFTDWFEALESMKNQIDHVDFDVAIIGAGAYGLPLAAYVKSIGKQAIQMSGATQILFGIKGKRWDEHPVISKFYNDSWVRPLPSETPAQIHKVEGGSYW